ncbi:HEPN family nuclease [Providencia rettgeri]|uniref:HEPN family nuclease n=1 Tax=Providencia rettgeri TaxID=587 RepID=UPI0032EC32CF
MSQNYTPEQRIIITSILNFSVLLSLWKKDYYKNEEFKKILLNNNEIDGNFIFSALKNVGIFNEGTLPAILYSLLIYPQEAIKKINCNTYDAAISNIDNNLKNSHYNINITTNDYPDLAKRSLLKHIRNAVSHATFKFDNDMFIFTDINPHNSKKITLEFNKNDIGTFIQDLYNALLLIIKEIQNNRQKTP